MDRIKRLTLALAKNTFESDFAQNLMRDLKSLRTTWNYVLCAAAHKT